MARLSKVSFSRSGDAAPIARSIKMNADEAAQSATAILRLKKREDELEKQ